uniref:Complex 1 LYR protein domain-containing protein n=1 Tax=Vitis vinifera TaxID=29760 RepID=A5AMQ7_VITVI|nr:hypothetical protein VITISV_021303 [Vitis vinifera]
MGSEALQATKVYRQLLKAVKNHIGKEDHKRHFRDHITQEFQKNRGLLDLSSIQQKLKVAHDYTYLLNSVHHHKAVVISTLQVFCKTSLPPHPKLLMICMKLSKGDLIHELLLSYNIAVDRSDEMKRILGKSASSVGLQLPEVYQP